MRILIFLLAFGLPMGFAVEPTLNVLFIVGGSNLPGQTQLVDLSDKGRTFSPTAPLNGSHLGSVGFFLNGKATVCGGYSPSRSCDNACWSYAPTSNRWEQTVPMQVCRDNFAGVPLTPNKFWFLGGLSDSNNKWGTGTTEIMTPGSGSQLSVNLPTNAEYPDVNAVQINDTHYLMTSGQQSWMYDKTGQKWTQLQDLQEKRLAGVAGLVQYPNGVKAVFVVGGIWTVRTTEMYNLAVGTSWQYGPAFPEDLSNATPVPYGNSFLIVGWTNKIYTFDVVKLDWVVLKTIANVGSRPGAFLVPDNFVSCTYPATTTSTTTATTAATTGSTLDLLFIINNYNFEGQTQIIDLSGKGRICTPTAALSGTLMGSVGFFLNGKATVCGGLTPNGTRTTACWNYVPNSNSWEETMKMKVSRQYFAGVQMSPTKFWCLGGLPDVPGYGTPTTEILTAGSGFQLSVNLPSGAEFQNVNVVKLNQTHYFMISGKQTWMYDLAGQQWTQLQDLQQYRISVVTGLVQYSNGTRVIIAVGGVGGERTTEVYNLDRMTNWQYGPMFPETTRASTSVQYGNSFLIVGNENRIYTFDTVKNGWTIFKTIQGTSVGYIPGAFLVPNNFVQCK